jgi:subtilisin family serine protease
MKKIALFLTVLILQNFLNAQSVISPLLSARLNMADSDTNELVWIFFKDKGIKEETAFKASELLSQRALQRREKVSGSRKIDITDMPVCAEYIAQIEKLGIQIKQKSKWLNAVSVITRRDKINEISHLSCVKQIDLVIKGSAKKPLQQEENTTALRTFRTTAHKHDYGYSLPQMELEKIPEVHDLGYTGKGVVIAIMDAGVDNIDHPAFDSLNKRGQILAHYDFVNKRSYIGNGNGGLGEGSHGTCTLSVIGGYKEGTLIGPAFDAKYILAKTENTDSETPLEEDNWIAAIEWADSIGVDVTSTSLGYLDFDSPYPSYTWQNMDGKTARITRAACLAVKKGIVVVNSAGNEGYNSIHNTLGAPADGDSIITVGAVSSSGMRSSFSSVGPTTDGRIKPDVMAQGSSIYAADGTVYSYTQGTSFSCPIAAGIAALILQANPDLTPIRIRDIMRSTASKAASPDNLYGWGIVNALAAVNIASGKTDTSESERLPSTFTLKNNYPNPFNGITNFRFSIQEKAVITLKIYNTLGQQVALLFSREYLPGSDYSFTWDTGSLSLASGIYIARLSSPAQSKSIKVMLIK